MQTTQFAQLDTSVLLIELTFTQNVEMEHTVLVDRVKLLNALQGNLEQVKPSISDKMLVVFHVVQDNIVMQNQKLVNPATLDTFALQEQQPQDLTLHHKMVKSVIRDIIALVDPLLALLVLLVHKVLIKEMVN